VTEGSAGDEGVGIEPSGELAGVPDGYQRLWTPHRMVYLQGDNRPVTGSAGADCPFCRAPGMSDEEGLVVARGKTCFVVMNLYPYNSGHVLICPYRHVGWYPDLTPAEAVEFGELTSTAMRVLSATVGCHGFNVGMNQGTAAGAGIAAHLHQHVVPRWGGDANFFPIVARTRALAELLGDTRRRLADGWPHSARLADRAGDPELDPQPSS
jgi:ATP adenylyltransferase